MLLVSWHASYRTYQSERSFTELSIFPERNNGFSTVYHLPMTPLQEYSASFYSPTVDRQNSSGIHGSRQNACHWLLLLDIRTLLEVRDFLTLTKRPSQYDHCLWSISHPAFSAYTDIFLVAIPVFALWQIQLKVRTMIEMYLLRGMTALIIVSSKLPIFRS